MFDEKPRLALRVVIAGLLLGQGVSKFFTYGQSVQFFGTLGLPVPTFWFWSSALSR
ncbi:DoxX family membrane protein [Haloarcula japonica]|uniref:DoxX family membrane protein n=1 Tax=Haloarcula japonica TaxID=29282 RepID=UPI0039F6C5E9